MSGKKHRIAVGEYPEGSSDGIETHFPEWLIDVSEMPSSYSFVPCDDGLLNPSLLAFRYTSPRCPGQLKGVYHKDGESAASEWKSQNDGWHEKYRRQG